MTDHQRLFFALWPPEPVQVAIAECADTAGISGRRVATERVHLTLAFLGNVDSAAVAHLETLAGVIEAHAFELVLTRYGHFPRAGIDLAGSVQRVAAEAI